MEPSWKYRLFITACFMLLLQAPEVLAAGCKPTEPDMLGPFYKPNAPVRSSVGKGYTLQGRVLSAKDCSPLAGAVVELWLTGPGGEYDDSRRATVRSGAAGTYQFESNVPPPYGGRPPHIHIRASAKGFDTLVTQHYPEQGSDQANFDLVLKPSR